ncbi:MAG: ABC transporter permease [Acidobacteriaceae bacterium]|nr:ABC transporter permease [Acidobacteriaceae bacterium]
MSLALPSAVRRLLKSPGFTLVAITALALGIGANVALFSVVNSVILRPPPYDQPEPLVRLSSTNPKNNLARVGFSYSRFLDVQQRQPVFSSLALAAGNAFTLTGRGDPEQVVGLLASATLLPTLGLQPIIGRNFSPEEDQHGGAHVVLMTRAMWQLRFNSDAAVLGQTLILNDVPYTIIGVLPAEATAFPLDEWQLWVPRPADVPYLSPAQLEGGGYFFQVIARLKPGVSLAQARAAMNVIAEGYRAAHPGNVDAPSLIELTPLIADAVGAEQENYWLLFGAVACVLLIACANIANLLLVRFAVRRQDITIRFALGARRWDVVRQLVSESLLLAMLGGVIGVSLAYWILRALVVFGVGFIPRVAEIRLDPLALVFALMVTLATGILTGLFPAMQASDVNVSEILNHAGKGSVRVGERIRAGLLMVEVSLSLVLLIAAGLLLTSFGRLQRVDLGFEAKDVFTAQMALPRSYSRPKLINFYEQVSQQLATRPGVVSVALSNYVPPAGNLLPTAVAVVGRSIPPPSERATAIRHLVSPHYFSTLRIALSAGRDFDERDTAREPNVVTIPDVVIINEAFARQHFPGEDPIGRTLITGTAQRPAQVVGVVANIRSENLSTPPTAEYFLPLSQRPEGPVNVIVRSRLRPAAVAALIRETLREVDPTVPLVQPEALTTRIAHTLTGRKFALMLLATFAMLALLLAVLGIYSVMAYIVAFRVNEIGLRMALGATSGQVMRMVLGQSRRLVLGGIAVGVVAALTVSQMMQRVLFEVKPAEPLVYVALSVLVLLVAEAAAYVPARRATRVDPMIALRAD